MAFHCIKCGKKATHVEYKTITKGKHEYIRTRYLCQKHAGNKATPVVEEETVKKPLSYIP